ncbi:MAG: peroxiredoxin family protein [Leptothrix sp. (in: b-proteobacteria)]
MDTRPTLKGASDSLRTPEPLARRAVMRSLLGLGMLGLAFDWSEPRLPGDSIGITSSAQVRPGQAYAFKALPNNARLWLQLNGQSIPDSGTLDLNLTPGFDNTLFAYVAIMPGDPAPDFSGTDTNGQLHSLGALRGKWVLVTFGDWGCAGSRQFAPVLASLYSQYHSLGLEALSVLLCPNSEARLANPTDLSDWTQTYGANYPVISDANNATQYYNREYLSCTYYSCSDQPSIFLIDPQGNITRRYRGWDANDGLATVLAGLQF